MAALGNYFQDTDVFYQTFESNLEWEIINPGSHLFHKSDIVGIPLINGEL